MNTLTKVVIATFAAAVIHPLAAQFNSYTVPQATTAIQIDGKLTEDDWKKAPLVSAFNPWKCVADIPETRAWIVQEKEHLVLAMECMEEFPDAMRNAAGHDGTIWQDDHIEIFLDTAGERKSYVQILVNAKGVVSDCFVGNALLTSQVDWSWESEAEVKTTVGQDRWCLEMRIPFAVLPPFVPGNDWTFHLARSRYTMNTQHMTSLQGPLNGFHEVSRFDFLCGIAGASSGIQTLEQSFGDISEGETRSWIKVKNQNAEPQNITIVLEVGQGTDIQVTRTASVSVPPNAVKRVDMVWPCNQGMVGKSILMRLEKDGNRVQAFSRPIQAVLPMLGELAVNIGTFSASSPTVFTYSINVPDFSRPMTVCWELWTDDGENCLLQGRTAVRGKAQSIRIFATGMTGGLYKLRRFLVEDASGAVMKGREDSISLVKSPWQD